MDDPVVPELTVSKLTVLEINVSPWTIELTVSKLTVLEINVSKQSQTLNISVHCTTDRIQTESNLDTVNSPTPLTRLPLHPPPPRIG